VLSNHDTVRHASRFGLKDPTTFPKGIAADDEQPDAALGLARARAATLVALALPGSAYIYQGEELGLPEHTTLPAEARQDPTFFRTRGAETGRDGCRVPLPWAEDQPGFGFSITHGGPAAEPWLPQPESFGPLAADQQDGEEGSTLELYRAAIRFRSARRLGLGSLEWTDEHAPDSGLLAFRNGDVLVVANMGFASAPVPEGYSVALSSGPEPAEDWAGMREVPVDCTVYLQPK
jgi:alpha-glucosidase